MSTDYLARRIVPVVVIDDARKAEPLARALVAGGLPVAEVTFRTDAAADAMEIMSQVEGLIVGAGTVVTPQQVELAVESGAKFLVSPGLRADVIREAQTVGVPIIPGVVTPSEIMQAMSLGLRLLKFFPASIYGGAKAIKALASPFGSVRFVPTGGVTRENLDEYLALPNVAAVGGSWMVPASALAASDYQRITDLCAEAVAAAAGF